MVSYHITMEKQRQNYLETSFSTRQCGVKEKQNCNDIKRGGAIYSNFIKTGVALVIFGLTFSGFDLGLSNNSISKLTEFHSGSIVSAAASQLGPGGLPGHIPGVPSDDLRNVPSIDLVQVLDGSSTPRDGWKFSERNLFKEKPEQMFEYLNIAACLTSVGRLEIFMGIFSREGTDGSAPEAEAKYWSAQTYTDDSGQVKLKVDEIFYKKDVLQEKAKRIKLRQSLDKNNAVFWNRFGDEINEGSKAIDSVYSNNGWGQAGKVAGQLAKDKIQGNSGGGFLGSIGGLFGM